MREVDIAVVGGGPIGLTAGLALDALGYRVRVFERRPAQEARDDRRVLALAEGSRLILSRLGVWQTLADITPIERILVSDALDPARVVLTATEAHVPALGYVTTFNALQHALSVCASGRNPPFVVHGTQATVLEAGPASAELKLDGVETGQVRASLVLHAEGAPHHQGVAPDPAAPGAEHSKDYGQHAIVAEVWPEHAVAQEAFEHFTPAGPVALLPLDGHYALIWTVPASERDALMDLTDPDFCERLNRVLPQGAGAIVRTARRGAFPLRMRMARKVADTRALLLGNAAQQLHPVAAQGFNLGLRDVWTLRELLWNRPADPGAAPLLDQYARQRRRDRHSSLWITDGMVSIFGSANPFLRTGRGLALRALSQAHTLRAAFARRMMFGA